MKTMANNTLILALGLALISITNTTLVQADQYGIDYPHYQPNSIGCTNCHYMVSDADPPEWVEHVPQDIDDTSYNNLCWTCHTGGVGEAPYEEPHSSLTTSNQYGAWAIECRTCHWPHHQLQLRTYGAQSYVYTNTVSGRTTTTLTKTDAGWTENQYVGYILLPNTAQISYNYKISANTSDTITVDQTMNLTKVNIGDTFAIFYGKLIKDTITTPNSGNKTVKFFRREGPDPNSFADGNATYDGPCEVCHTKTKHFRNNGSGSDQNHSNIGGAAGTNCITCHSHSGGFGHGSGGSGGGCIECHGHDAGYEYEPGKFSQGRGSSFSHSTHTENDSDDLKGPNIACSACHDTNKFPYFKSGTDSNGDGKYSLAETDVCNTCHSPGGAYDGVNDPEIGAKANWEAGIYSGLSLKTGKEKWCATCHDEAPSQVQGVNAPNIVGDEDGAYTYGTGWGYYKTGHGVASASTYPSSGERTYGAGKKCDACHDFATAHIDGNARTYSAGSDNYQAGYRLNSIGGKAPMIIPRPTNSNQRPLVADDFRLCFSCHDANRYLLQSPDPVMTSFRDDRGDAPSSGDAPPISAHEYHLNNMGLRFDSDWEGGYDSQISCVNCHNVHGSSRLSMVRDGKLENKEPGLEVFYAKDGVTTYNPPWPPNEPNNVVSLADSDGTIWAGNSPAYICSACHGGNYIKYYRTPPAAQQAPVLAWTGEGGYGADGAEPNSGPGGAYFSFRVKYSDANYQTPRTIQVWVDRNDDGDYEDANEKIDMQDANPSDVDCSDGKLYRKTVAIAKAGDGILNYRFHASDGALDATGAPTANKTITITNNAPVLAWTDETGYEADGVSPNSAASGSSFIFRVNYKDVDNNAPTVIQVWIDANDNGSYEENEKFNMAAVDPGDTNYADGKLYTASRAIALAGDGTLTYRFYASDGSANATGTPTTSRSLTVTDANSAPVLDWTGETNYERDGVNPDSGTDGESFTFRIKYSDSDNNPPSIIQVWVDKNDNGTYEAGEKYDMTAVAPGDTDYTDGRLYTKTMTLAAAGDGSLNYRFYASDGTLEATGVPTAGSSLTLLVDAITVSCTGGKNYTTIQAAVNAASSGDTILVSDCTYTEKVTVDNKDITIKSANGPDVTIIDGGGSGGSVVKFQNGADATLNGLTVRNGAGGLTGGGIYISSSSPTIVNSIITGNDADNGAGIYVAASASTVTITNSTVSNNITSALDGGGLYLGSGSSTVINGGTAFNNNRARYGGGVYVTTSANASLTITDSSFNSNRGTISGGAAYLTVSGGTVPIAITTSTFSDNDANDNGGALFITPAAASATLTITDSTFTGNNTTAQGSALDGGAIYYTSIPATTISGSTFTNNSGRNGGALYVTNSGANVLSITDSVINSNASTALNGGGLYINGGAAGTYAATVERTTVAGNTADDNGGGVFLTGAIAATFTNCLVTGNKTTTLDGGGLHLTGATTAPAIINSTIAGNSAASHYGGGICTSGGLGVTLTNTILWNNLDSGIYGDIFGPATATYSDIWQPGFSGSNNISSDPLFIAPVDPSLAPTTNGNYHLLADSPAMDNGTAIGAPSDDIDGNVRPIGAGHDMGADEIVTVVNTAPVLSWTDETGFAADGVNPDLAVSGASFEFRINYSDADNDPPSAIEVWVDVNDNGVYEAGEKYAMTAVDAGDSDYTDGKLYTKSLTLNYAGDGALKYRFYAKDAYSMASGLPASDKTVITYSVPVLSWIGSGNFVSDGVDPESGVAGSTFEFRIRYTSATNTPPSSIQVWVDKNDDSDYLDDGEKISMTALVPADTNYADGKDYTVSMALAKAGDDTLNYRFYASDGTPATGEPTTTDKPVTVTNNVPALAWTGEANFVGNGVDPDAALVGSSFTFRVKYTDADNEAPVTHQVWIDENNNASYEAGEKFDMALAGDATPANDGNYANGEIYTKARTLNTAGNILYKFAFSDATNAATGAPTSDSTVTVTSSANHAPVLSWATGACLTDGARPRTGAKDTDFEFRVTYSDEDNQCPPTPPQVMIGGTPYDLTSNDGASCQTGRIYYRAITMANAGDFNYSFSASDGIDAATGHPATNHVVSVINTTLKVKPAGDAGWGGAGWYNTIQNAINASTDPSTILVYPNSDLSAATYTEGGAGISFLNTKPNRTLQSVCGRDLTTISTGATVVTINSNNVTVDGFTITGGTTYGVYFTNNSAISDTLKNNKINANAQGVYVNLNSTVTIEDSLIQNNTTRGINSALASSLLKVYRSTISDNNPGAGGNAGGGISYSSGSGTHIIEDSIISNNKSGASNGGGIYIINGSLVTIKRSTINNNSGASGAGIFSNSSSPTLTITDSYIQGNSATASGGGIIINTGTTTLTNVILTGNKAATNGGAIYTNTTTGTTDCLYCTISGNYAGNIAGAIYRNAGTTTIKNSIIYNNDALTQPNYKQIWAQTSGWQSIDVYNTLINQVPGGASYLNGYESLGGNLNEGTRGAEVPSFVDGKAPASAPTTTGNYHIQSDSWCIDTGGNYPASPDVDIDGDARPQDIVGKGDGANDYDMGADEYKQP